MKRAAAERSRRAAFRALPQSGLVNVEPLWQHLYKIRETEGQEVFREVVDELARRVAELHESKA
jgi:hypothetical protein